LSNGTKSKAHKGHLPKPEIFFQETNQAFDRAGLKSGEIIEHDYQLGRFSIRLRFAGQELIPFFTPALSHLEIDPITKPDLTIHLWDSQSTATPMPHPPWTKDDYMHFGLIRGYNNERINTLFMNALHMIDLKQDQAVYWVPDSGNIPYYHTIRPLRTIINWWLNQHQHFIVHAAAVGLPEGGVLITGKGGAGKSTTALACVGAGIQYAGDENVVISSSPEPYLHNLYCSGTLDADDIDRILAIKPYLSNASKLAYQKAIYLFHDDDQKILSKGFPIKAILIPEVSGKVDTTIQARSVSQSLIALAPETLFQLPGAGAEHFQAMVSLIKQVPCYTLELGSQIVQIPNVIETFLRDRL
jgi:hypothetical protein